MNEQLEVHDAPNSARVMAAVQDLIEEETEITSHLQERLQEIGSPLGTFPGARERLSELILSVLLDVQDNFGGAGRLRVQDVKRENFTSLPDYSGPQCQAHPCDLLKAGPLLGEILLNALADRMPPDASPREMAAAACVIQQSTAARVARRVDAYVEYLQEGLRESHLQERKRISRELHDRICHDLTTVSRSLELFEILKGSNPLQAETMLETAKEVAKETLDTARRLSTELRRTAADEGLEIAISDLIRAQVPSEIEAWVSFKGSDTHVSPYVRDEIFLIVREALRNALKHSGATKIRAELTVLPYQINASVQDNGRGAYSETDGSLGGSGIDIMRERTVLMQGTFIVGPAPGGGTLVAISAPLIQPHTRTCEPERQAGEEGETYDGRSARHPAD